MKPNLSHSELLRLLSYDPETGVFRWKVRRQSVAPGDIAGCVDPRIGYSRIKINERLYLAHRLAWFYVHGEWPAAEIDHRDRDRANNRISNLRQATRGENQRNKPVYRNNRSGSKGVHWHKQHRKFVATIHVNKRPIHLGLFRNIKDAARAYEEAAQNLHGSFARCA